MAAAAAADHYYCCRYYPGAAEKHSWRRAGTAAGAAAGPAVMREAARRAPGGCRPSLVAALAALAAAVVAAAVAAEVHPLCGQGVPVHAAATPFPASCTSIATRGHERPACHAPSSRHQSNGRASHAGQQALLGRHHRDLSAHIGGKQHTSACMCAGVCTATCTGQ
eukprot:1158461-Pelagomonas_calceolata.AAC.4